MNAGMVLRDAAALRGVDISELESVVPHIPHDMVDSLKFSAALPDAIAVRTLGERFADRRGAAVVAREMQADGPAAAKAEVR